MKIIGMIHLDALAGYPHHKDINSVIENAVADAKELERGGVDAILIENTYDDPHQIMVGKETVAGYTLVANKVIEAINVPLGICVLWNDYEAAIAIAKTVGAKFVRVPIFIENAITASGTIEATPYDVISYRHKIGANDIGILADIHVKHAGHPAKRPIEISAEEAIGFGADQIIITGQKTGDEPVIKDLEKVRKALPNATIVVGSGTTSENVKEIAKYANSAIVGTYFKEGNRMKSERVKRLIKEIKSNQ